MYRKTNETAISISRNSIKANTAFVAKAAGLIECRRCPSLDKIDPNKIDKPLYTNKQKEEICFL